jgi:hypothetical protein
MHAMIYRYAAIGGLVDDVVRAGRQLTAALGDVPGFVSCGVLDVGHGALASVCIFETRAQLEEGERLPGTWSSADLGFRLPPPRTSQPEKVSCNEACDAACRSISGRRQARTRVRHSRWPRLVDIGGRKLFPERHGQVG